MRQSAAKLIPTAVVGVLVAYCCWSGDQVAPPTSDKAKSSEISIALLKPSVPASPDRDPFGLKESATGKPPAKSDRTASPSLAKGAARPAEGKKAPEVKKLVATGLVLSATLLRGERRVAMINGHFIAEGELLKGVTGRSCTLARVYPDRVLLRQGEETVELKFPDKAVTRPGTASPSKPQAKPSRPGPAKISPRGSPRNKPAGGLPPAVPGGRKETKS